MKPDQRLEKFVALNVREACILQAASARPKSLFADDGGLPPLPFGFNQRGAVAIIDISGFTSLTTKLAERFGGGGGARIRAIINPVFSTLISAVHRYNGSVVKFVGDAIICCWQVNRFHVTAMRIPFRSSEVHYRSAENASLGSILTDSDESDEDLSENSSAVFREDAIKSAILSATGCCFEILGLFRNYKVAVPASEEQLAPPPLVRPRRRSDASSLPPMLSNSNNGARTPRKPPTPQRSDSTVPFPLKIHVGLGCGQFSSLHVGRTGLRAEYFVAGAAADDAMTLLKFSSPGEIALSVECWENLTDALQGREMSVALDAMFLEGDGRGCYIVREDVDDLTQIPQLLSGADNRDDGVVQKEAKFFPGWTDGHKLYLHESLSRVITEDPTSDQFYSMHNQIRNVCVVFVCVPSFGAPGKMLDLLSTAQKVTCTALDAINRYEGTMRQFNVDDKGASALLVWGVEGFTHERGEAVLAVLAALQIQTDLKESMGNNFSIGVAQGPVFSGIIGNSARSDGTVLGMAVNLAARLMCSPVARGSIICTESVYNACSGEIEFSPQQMVELKGIDTPQPAYVPLAKKLLHDERPSAPSTLAGREKEIAIIEEVIAAWAEEKTVRLFITGGSGLGKTALSNYVKIKASGVNDSIVCQAASSETYRLAPFHALRSILIALFQRIYTEYVETGILEYRVLEVEGDADTMKLVRSSTASVQIINPDRWAQLNSSMKLPNSPLGVQVAKVLFLIKESTRTMHVLYDILQIEQDTANAKGTVSGAKLNSQVASVVARVLNKFSVFLRIKLCIIFDDIQWQDTPGTEVLLDLEYTSEKGAEVFKRILSTECTRHVELGPLDWEGTMNLVKSRFHVEAIQPGLANKIWKQSQGIPIIVELLCESFRSKKEIEVVHGTLERNTTLSRPEDGDVLPVDLRSTFMAQVDRAPSSLKHILSVASVAGQYFSLTDILQVMTEIQHGSNDTMQWGNVKELLDYIRQTDRMNFLVASTESTTSATTADQTPRPKAGMRRGTLRRDSSFRRTAANDTDISMSFRHVCLQQCIYLSLLPERRDMLHDAFATFYESKLTQTSKSRTLPMLVYHLGRVPGQGRRKIQYAEQIFNFYSEESRHVELGIQAYERLLKLMEEFPHDAQFDALALAKHHRQLAMIFDEKWCVHLCSKATLGR
ncbi:hypothetical protein HK104_003228 [Borealophlyctis nickersoniae]|nr:hypothetical protein HK104_003228 [Borealophlyctis nickersoniae]